MAAVSRGHSSAVAERKTPESPSMSTVALDDPVPAGRTKAAIEPSIYREPPHQVEADVQRVLTAHPELKFKSLVVRRLKNGVCLEGVLEIEDDDAPDVCELARQVAGVEFVLNRLIVRSRCTPPRRKR